MINTAERILYRTSAQIFEQLAFLLPHSDMCQPSTNEITSAVVPFTGPFSGYLRLTVNSGVARELSCNILGSDDACDTVLQNDALGEIANIICGNALPAIFGFQITFNLDAPRICDESVPALSEADYSQAAETQIHFKAGIAEVRLFTESRILTDPSY